MIHFSEYVSIGHPDKIADAISQYLLDRYIECDPNTRYAVEVQIKDNHVTLGGEVTSNKIFSNEQIEQFVRNAVNDIGYDLHYFKTWGAKNTICGSFLDITTHIGQQSEDIAIGVNDNDGWGDQGIFFGMAEYDEGENEYMPKDYAIARRLNKELFEAKLGGLDIKTQIVMDNNVVKRVICAIPLLSAADKHKVLDFIHTKIKGDYELILNGTGTYVKHASVADCGTTGRKLAVDFYGGNCRIGGGSPWTKDGSKADLCLNLFARKMAKDYAIKHKTTIYTSLACCIGQSIIDYTICNACGKVIEEGSMHLPVSNTKKLFGLDKPIFASMNQWGLFGEYQKDKYWEK